MFDNIKSLLRGEMPTKLLIKRGLKVGKKFNRQQGCIIDPHHCWLIEIGDNVTLAPRVHILAHDASTKRHLNYTKIGRVSIGNNVFIGAGSIILPNVTIGDNVVVGAGSVITKNIPEGNIVVGNPAKIIGKTCEFVDRNTELFRNRPVYDKNWTLRNNISNEDKKIMISQLEDGVGFVE